MQSICMDEIHIHEISIINLILEGSSQLVMKLGISSVQGSIINLVLERSSQLVMKLGVSSMQGCSTAITIT